MHNEGMRHMWQCGMWHCGTLYIFVFIYVFTNEYNTYLSQNLRKNLANVVISEMAK